MEDCLFHDEVCDVRPGDDITLITVPLNDFVRFALLALLVIVAHCSAHICLTNPPQRDNIPETLQPGDPSCAITTGPCGATPQGPPKLYYKGGTLIRVSFQKNLDHWNSATPGSFEILFTEHPTANFHPLLKIPDTATPSLTLYNENVTLPATPTSTGIIQVIYTPNGGVPTFYSCSDIGVL